MVFLLHGSFILLFNHIKIVPVRRQYSEIISLLIKGIIGPSNVGINNGIIGHFRFLLSALAKAISSLISSNVILELPFLWEISCDSFMTSIAPEAR